jgi:hypothetical protein
MHLSEERRAVEIGRVRIQGQVPRAATGLNLGDHTQ